MIKKWDRIALLFISPFVIYFALLVAYPIFMALASSLSDWNILTGEMKWRGLVYYKKVFQDSLFYKSLKNSFVYLIVQVPLSIGIGMFVALLLNQRIRFRTFFRTAYFLPLPTSVIILSILWSWIYQTEGGVLNYLLSLVGLPAVGWLTSERLSMVSIALMKVWTDIGLYSVLFLGALQAVPKELLESGKLDGATSWQLFWHITLPLLNPAIVFSVVMATIWGLQIFAEPFLMTQGGPIDSSQTLALYLYREAFIWSRLGYGCAIGVVTSLIILLATLMQRRLIEQRISY